MAGPEPLPHAVVVAVIDFEEGVEIFYSPVF